MAREVIEQAAIELGGMKRLVAWVQEAPENERAFWSSMYTKLLPMQVAGDATSGNLVEAAEQTRYGAMTIIRVGSNCARRAAG